MFVASCPHCGDSVTVPLGARPTARVRCPLCTSEYTLAEVLDGMPPALELLDGPSYGGHAEYAAYEGGEGHVATMVASDDSDIALADAEPRAERPAYSFDGGAATTTAESSPRKVRSSARPARPKPNMIFEMLKIALGGLAAIPISQLILWWAASTDPFELAPWLEKNAPSYIAVIAPEKLRRPNEGKAAQAQDAPAPAAGKKTKSAPPAGLPKLDSTELKAPFELSPATPAVDPNDPAATLPDSDPLDPKIDFEPLTPPGEDADPAEMKTPAAADPFALPEPTVDPAAAPAPVTPAEPQAAPEAEPLVKDAPRYTAPELDEATKTAANALQAWTEGGPKAATPEEKAKLLRSLYSTLAGVGERLGHANVADPAVENQLPAIREMLFSLQADNDVLGMIGRVGAAWLKPTTRNNDGIVLLGAVREVTSAGKVFETTLELEDKNKTTVAVVSSADPQESYQVGDRMMILGAIVADPTKINGYEGDAAIVVLNAMHARVSQ